MSTSVAKIWSKSDVDILNGAVVEERSEAACRVLSSSGDNNDVFLHFFLDVYGGDSKRFVSVGSQRTLVQVRSCDVEGCVL